MGVIYLKKNAVNNKVEDEILTKVKESIPFEYGPILFVFWRIFNSEFSCFSFVFGTF